MLSRSSECTYRVQPTESSIQARSEVSSADKRGVRCGSPIPQRTRISVRVGRALATRRQFGAQLCSQPALVPHTCTPLDYGFPDCPPAADRHPLACVSPLVRSPRPNSAAHAYYRPPRSSQLPPELHGPHAQADQVRVLCANVELAVALTAAQDPAGAHGGRWAGARDFAQGGRGWRWQSQPGEASWTVSAPSARHRGFGQLIRWACAQAVLGSQGEDCVHGHARHRCHRLCSHLQPTGRQLTRSSADRLAREPMARLPHARRSDPGRSRAQHRHRVVLRDVQLRRRGPEQRVRRADREAPVRVREPAARARCRDGQGPRGD